MINRLRGHVPDNPYYLIIAIAVLIGSVWVTTHPIVWTWDSWTYLENALAFVGKSENGTWYFRGIMVPLLLIISYVPWSEVLWPFIFLQTVLGIAAVGMFYCSTLKISQGWAIILTLLLIVSMTPFLYATTIMTEQTFYFFLVFILFASVRLISEGNLKNAILLAIALAGLALTRSNGPYFAYLIFPLVFFGARNHRHFVLASIAVYFALTMLSSYVVGSMPARHIWVTGMSQNESTFAHSTSGKFLFHVIYTNDVRGSQQPFPVRVHPENGPNSKAFFDRVRYYFTQSDPEMTAGNIDTNLARHFKGDIPALMNSIIEEPNVTKFWMLWSVLDVQIGPAEADRLFFEVWKEAVLADPVAALSVYVENLRQIIFNQLSMIVPLTPDVAPLDNLPLVQMKSELINSGDQTRPFWVDYVIDGLNRVLIVFSVFGMVLTAPFIFTAAWRLRFIWLIALAISGGIYGSVMIGSVAEFRYIYYSLPSNLFACGVGLATFFAWRRTRKVH